ncbi:MAG: coproporphyrinogen dehydrogenase HemZ [Eubacteriales bacterium]|nr:coproporphyrinogen dehydrogenase HemZ [Eubacteriales bacterium]
MILAIENKELYAYEIHSLIKAFYPEKEVKVYAEGSESYARYLAHEKTAPEISLRFAVIFSQEDIVVRQGERSFSARERGFTAEGRTANPENEEEAGNEAHPADQEEGRIDYSVKSKVCKDVLKHLLYRALCELTGRTLPWGELIGIRPTKIAMTHLLGGETAEQAQAALEREYCVSGEKAALAVEIASREREILAPIHYENGYSLYIGIPFCPTTCLYCSFTSFPIASWQDRVAAYLDALEREMAHTAALMRGRILDTVYIGGGTPTTLSAPQLERLLLAVERYFPLERLQEYTVEAGRADSITPEKLTVLKAHGITRISVNPQTMKDETLRLIGRHHTVAQVKEAFSAAREAGFDNINMDLILGLPGETQEDVAYTIQEVEKLSPDSLTVHSLAIKRASRLNQWIEKNGISSIHNTDDCMRIAAEGAHRLGMNPYYLYRQKNMSGNFENVGYAREGRYGIYNILIMEEKQSIMALGAGSISKALFPGGRIERSDNCKDVATYIQNIEEMLHRKERLFAE